jgi:hypothetical protein
MSIFEDKRENKQTSHTERKYTFYLQTCDIKALHQGLINTIQKVWGHPGNIKQNM